MDKTDTANYFEDAHTRSSYPTGRPTSCRATDRQARPLEDVGSPLSLSKLIACRDTLSAGQPNAPLPAPWKRIHAERRHRHAAASTASDTRRPRSASGEYKRSPRDHHDFNQPNQLRPGSACSKAALNRVPATDAPGQSANCARDYDLVRPVQAGPTISLAAMTRFFAQSYCESI